MSAVPPSCPPLPDLPPIFWRRVAQRIAYWQRFHAESKDKHAPIATMRKQCIARIKTRLKRIDSGKDPGRSLFELSEYVACLKVIESRN